MKFLEFSGNKKNCSRITTINYQSKDETKDGTFQFTLTLRNSDEYEVVCAWLAIYRISSLREPDDGLGNITYLGNLESLTVVFKTSDPPAQIFGGLLSSRTISEDLYNKMIERFPELALPPPSPKKPEAKKSSLGHFFFAKKPVTEKTPLFSEQNASPSAV